MEKFQFSSTEDFSISTLTSALSSSCSHCTHSKISTIKLNVMTIVTVECISILFRTITNTKRPMLFFLSFPPPHSWTVLVCSPRGQNEKRMKWKTYGLNWSVEWLFGFYVFLSAAFPEGIKFQMIEFFFTLASSSFINFRERLENSVLSLRSELSINSWPSPGVFQGKKV